ncbi:MAG: DUF4381 family protein [Polyangiaceae bacterium]
MRPRDWTAALAAMAPAAAGAQPDIRDIRGPISIPSIWPTLLVAAAAAALLLVLGAATYALVRHLRHGRTRTPAEIALARLEKARAIALDGRAAELGAEVSDAVRAYVEAQFELRAAHRTTEEFLHDLVATSASPLAAHRDPLAAFLGACDLAKFARFAIDVEHMGAMIDAAEAFVRATSAPAAPVVPEKTAPGAPTREVPA